MQKIIYEITTYPKKENDFLSIRDFYEHWFMNSIADRLDDTIDRNIYLNLFKKWLENKKIGKFNSKNNSFVIIEQGKENYFNSKFKQFKDEIAKLNRMNFSDFSTGSNNIEKSIDTLNSLFSEEYKNYVSLDDKGISTFDNFIRYAEVGKNYYIGGILKYHF